jgi:hypothetical protein
VVCFARRFQPEYEFATVRVTYTRRTETFADSCTLVTDALRVKSSAARTNWL